MKKITYFINWTFQLKLLLFFFIQHVFCCYTAKSEDTLQLLALVSIHGFTPPGGQVLELQFEEQFLPFNRWLVSVIKKHFLNQLCCLVGLGERSPLPIYGRTSVMKPYHDTSRAFECYSPDLTSQNILSGRYFFFFCYWNGRSPLKYSNCEKYRYFI